ncbi:MAG: type II toxin-antitoxin system CcdA family antitoxin [Steroidobacteraceae bacterium]|jgi:antitoxin CcdA|nr:type II toxin-antitoxin system CcdA family antitoxin [Steroidobacteraceae bacterium]
MSSAVKKAVNLSVDTALLKAARAHDINLSATLEAAISRELRERRRTAWTRRNASAIQAYNEDVDAHGTFSDGLRAF